MIPEELKDRNFENEFIFSASRSSGPGGQNINKVNTRVELRFSIVDTTLLSEEEKALIYRKLAKKISKEGDLLLNAQSERTQLMNKRVVTEKFFIILAKTLTIPAKRKSTKPTISAVRKRLDDKRSRGLTKKFRKLPGESSGE